MNTLILCTLFLALSALSHAEKVSSANQLILKLVENSIDDGPEARAGSIKTCAWQSSTTCSGKSECASLATDTCLTQGTPGESQKFTVSGKTITQTLWTDSTDCSTTGETVTYTCNKCSGADGISIKFECSGVLGLAPSAFVLVLSLGLGMILF